MQDDTDNYRIDFSSPDWISGIIKHDIFYLDSPYAIVPLKLLIFKSDDKFFSVAASFLKELLNPCYCHFVTPFLMSISPLMGLFN